MATKIQIQRYSNSSWNNPLYPRTSLDNIVKSASNSESILENGKIAASLLPNFLLGQMVFAGTITLDGTYIQNNSGTNSDGWVAAGLIAGTPTVSLTDSGKSKLGTSKNTVKLVYSPSGGGDGSTTFNFSDCENCYFMMETPENMPGAYGNSYNLFNVGTAQDPEPLLSDVRVGDWILATSSGWRKIDNTDTVISVCGKTGVIALGISDITNLSSTLDGKAPTANPTFTGTVKMPFASAGFVKTNASGVLSVDTSAYTTTANAMKTITMDSTNKKLTFTAANGSTTLRTLTFASGSNNGTIKITSNENGTPSFEVAVKGLGSAAYTNSTAYASSSHGHDVGDLYTPEQDDGKEYVAYCQSANEASWKEFNALPEPDIANNKNGLMTPANVKTLNCLTSSSTSSLSANNGDLCFVTLT